jgi:kynurenine formamidase
MEQAVVAEIKFLSHALAIRRNLLMAGRSPHVSPDVYCLDVTEHTESSRDYQIGTEVLAAWEQKHGRLPAGAIVLFRTGFSNYWPDAESYLGTSKRGDEGAQNLHFPGLRPDAADWLARERQVASVGIDTASIDYGQSRDFRAHVTLMQANVPAFENLANLDLLPATGAFVVALPTKIKGGSGGPLRIVARIQDLDDKPR